MDSRHNNKGDSNSLLRLSGIVIPEMMTYESMIQRLMM